MKKLIASMVLMMLFGQIFTVSATTTTADACRQYAYGYQADGHVYMILSGKKYGPFENMDQFKFTLTRMGPQFQQNLKQYMLMDPNGSYPKYLVYQEQLGDCNPYVLDMDTVVTWNAKITALFLTLNNRFLNNPTVYKIALAGAIAKVEAKMVNTYGKNLEILKLIRDRFIAKMQTL